MQVHRRRNPLSVEADVRGRCRLRGPIPESRTLVGPIFPCAYFQRTEDHGFWDAQENASFGTAKEERPAEPELGL